MLLWCFEALWEKYDNFLRNKKLLNNPNNLAVYKKDKTCYYFADLKQYPLFKKCDLAVNTYYWKIKTRDGSLFYTTVEQEDEPATLLKIAQTTKLTELRERMTNDFFEYILISFVMNENEKLMEDLDRGQSVEYNGVTVKTQDFYKSDKRSCHDGRDESSEIDTTEQSSKMTTTTTPDLSMEQDGKTWIFDAYNGSSEKEVRRKLNLYKNDFRTNNVFVFASGISASEQFVKWNTDANFKIYTLDGDRLVKCEEDIIIGSITISAALLSEKYFFEFAMFSDEVYYWLRCRKANKIHQRLK